MSSSQLLLSSHENIALSKYHPQQQLAPHPELNKGVHKI
jgi:hypothetical protein